MMKVFNYLCVFGFLIAALLNALVIATEDTEPVMSASGLLVLVCVLGAIGYIQLIRKKNNSKLILLLFSIAITASALFKWAIMMDEKKTGYFQSALVLAVSAGSVWIFGWWAYIRARRQSKLACKEGVVA